MLASLCTRLRASENSVPCVFAFESAMVELFDENRARGGTLQGTMVRMRGARLDWGGVHSLPLVTGNAMPMGDVAEGTPCALIPSCRDFEFRGAFRSLAPSTRSSTTEARLSLDAASSSALCR